MCSVFLDRCDVLCPLDRCDVLCPLDRCDVLGHLGHCVSLGGIFKSLEVALSFMATQKKPLTSPAPKLPSLTHFKSLYFSQILKNLSKRVDLFTKPNSIS